MGRRQAAVLRRRPRPALVVWGAQDPYVPASLAAKQRQAFPDAQIHVLQGDGHWPFVDEPERVLRLVVPFLRHAVR
jgi:pimeloyl-ACP methyl ester carboxylesterase